MTVLIFHLSFSNLHIFKVSIFIFQFTDLFFKFQCSSFHISSFQIFKFPNVKSLVHRPSNIFRIADSQIWKNNIFKDVPNNFLYFSKTFAPSKLPKCR